MAHSRRRYPVIVHEKDNKTAYNRRLRRKIREYLRTGKRVRFKRNFVFYKKYWLYKDAVEKYQKSERFPTLESWLEYYKRVCFRK